MNGIFCPSVRREIIVKFSGVITKDQGKVQAKGQGHPTDT